MMYVFRLLNASGQELEMQFWPIKRIGTTMLAPSGLGVNFTYFGYTIG